ncbi:MAG: NF038122 family metalloprotease [Xanthobacteraceae bacterium]
MVINVVYDSSVNNAPAGFVSGVQSVVNYFESHFSNPVTITIDVGYGEVMGQSLGSGALGESITYFDQVSYTQLRNALVANANAIGDSAAAASLPATSPVNGQWWVSTAEAEALGLSSASNNPDGYVGFSSSSNIFAYNENSIGINQYDFQAVVAHEICEVMGRQMFDGANAFGTGASYDPLDLFHYSAPGVRDFSGVTPGYASADGGKTSLDAFNTNRSGDFGDWASSAGNDAFNAFANPGVVNAITQSDLTELNLLGWDPASTTPPPPTTPVVTIALASDTGVSATDKITSHDTLTGTADPNAVVQIALGSTVLGNATASASGVWSFTPVTLAKGQYTVTASETNAAGLTGSANLAFTLDTTAPVVTSDMVSGSGITGGVGLLTAGEIAVFTLALSEPIVISGGLPALVLNDGGTALYDSSHSTSTTLAFDYTMAAGQFTNALAVTGINLNGATVTDVAGNNANLTGADTSFVNLLVDATTPKVVSAHAHDLLGGTVSVSAARGVLIGDSDANSSDALSVSAVLGSAANVGHSVAGAFGVLALNADGSYSYSNTNPGAVTAVGGVTEDLFNYTVSNGHGGTTDATLSVLITSPSDIYRTGSAGSTLKGGSGNYVLDGSAGHMNLTAGNQGQQWLVGGAGDVLNGGNSTDTFMFSPDFGKETINNFNPTRDVIDLPKSIFANFAEVQADMHAFGTSTVIVADPNDVITLSHVAVTSLHAQNFHFLV